jgi:nitrite reductase/ring-hydroxylating ferredoxin subunit
VDAFVGSCSHLACALYEGRVEDVAGTRCLVCPSCGSAYDLDSGDPRRGPAASAQEKLDVRMEAGRVLARLPVRHR